MRQPIHRAPTQKECAAEFGRRLWLCWHRGRRLSVGTGFAEAFASPSKPYGKGFYPRTAAIMPYDAAAIVNEPNLFSAARTLGEELRHARRRNKVTQKGLAAMAGIDLATVKNLEHGRGTVGSLSAMLVAVEHRFADQPPSLALGAWIASRRKSAGYSQQTFALRIGVSKPTVIQIEHGRGNIGSLLSAMGALGVATTVVPQADPLHGARLILGDCLAVMPTLPDQSVDAIITDLPFAVTALEWDQPIPLVPLWDQFRRLLKPTGVIVLNATQPFTTILAASNLGWLKESLVWEKSRVTGFLQSKKRHLKKHEDILVFSPGTVVSGNARQTARNMTFNAQGLVELEKPVRSRNGNTKGGRLSESGGHNTLSPLYRPCYIKPITEDGRSQTYTNYPTSILRFASESRPIHNCQKPLDLMRYLVRTYTNEGDTVLDCCFGSGTTGVAAVMEGRKFVGIEMDAGYFEMARERLMKAMPAT
jgi:site-specific DNA-methyltransferase (adenine-specific)